MSGSGVVSVLMCMVVKTKVRRLKFPKKILRDFYVIFVPGTSNTRTYGADLSGG